MTIKGIIAVAIVVAMSCFLVELSEAVPTNGVANTVHNLSISGTTQFKSTNEQEICVFCHIPHNANLANNKKFLWSRNDPDTTTFALYTASSTLDFDASGITLSEISKMCMSCHDGVTALNSMANGRGATINLVASRIGDVYNPDVLGIWGPNIGGGDVDGGILQGSDLTNDHPVSFEYRSSYDNGDMTIKMPVGDWNGSMVGELPLWDNGDGKKRVECVTCHDPHIRYDGAYVEYKPFLRKGNASSALCFTCHDK